MSNFETLVAGIELLYGVGRKLSEAIARQPCEYLIQEASMAFVKTMMSVFGFLRFIPASRFFAASDETVTDLSSTSVMGRQVLMDREVALEDEVATILDLPDGAEAR